MGELVEPDQIGPRPQVFREEMINGVSHGIGAVLAIVGTALLIARAAENGTALHLITVTIFGISMIVLYANSCLYHALTNPRAKHVFQVLDHCSIFLLISGTYTPISLVCIGGAVGWILFGVNTACMVLGIILNAINLTRWKRVSLVLYLVMGWMIILTLPTLYRSLTTAGAWFLALGGASYTVGIPFYKKKEKLYWHSIWHFFVLGGTILHYFAIYTNCCG